MNKPTSLNQFLLASIPKLADNPDQLQIFIDSGHLSTNLETSLHFEYAYTLNLILTDLALHPDAVLVPLLAWLRTNQPDLEKSAVQFEAEVIRKDLIDLSITVPLTERVLVNLNQDQNYQVQHLEEPTFEYQLPDPALFKALFADVGTGPELMTKGYEE